MPRVSTSSWLRWNLLFCLLCKKLYSWEGFRLLVDFWHFVNTVQTMWDFSIEYDWISKISFLLSIHYRALLDILALPDTLFWAFVWISIRTPSMPFQCVLEDCWRTPSPSSDGFRSWYGIWIHFSLCTVSCIASKNVWAFQSPLWYNE